LSPNRSLFSTLALIFFLSLAQAGPEESAGSELKATWNDNSTGEDGFKIERRTGTTQIYTQIAIVGANVTSYVDSGLSSMGRFTVIVRLRLTRLVVRLIPMSRVLLPSQLQAGVC
jgi:hypothetical protein